MSDLREQIRSILREELAALRTSPLPAPVARQTVRIDNDSDLLHFARALLARAQDPGFIADVQAGRVGFSLERHAPAPNGSVPVASPSALPGPSWSDKTLLTEKDMAALGQGQRVLRVGRHCRLTPLAKDEARRRGIKIERNAA